MSWTPLVSVITIFRDAERFLRDATDSVFAQSYGNWELLLVDDGSVDGSTTMAFALAAADSRRVRVLQHEGHQNRGMSRSRNLGIAHAKGEVVTFLDADDAWFERKLAEQVCILGEEPRASLVYGTRELWRSWDPSRENGEADSIVDLGVLADRLFRPPSLFTLTFAERGATNPGSDVMVRRDRALRIGGFEEAFRGMYEDQAFLVKIYLRESVWVSSRCWTRYRQHPDSCVSRWSRSAETQAATDAFTRWMEGYVRDCTRDGAVGRAALRALRWNRHPILSRIRSAVSRHAGRSGFRT